MWECDEPIRKSPSLKGENGDVPTINLENTNLGVGWQGGVNA